MKVLVSIALFAAVVLAEPPRYRPQYQQQRQYYFARLQEEAVDGAAPYPASGWKPAGRAFNLPERQFAGAQQQYGAPSASQQPEQQYGAPSASQQPEQQYGAPTQREYGAPEEPATTESPNNDDEEVSTVQGIASSESEAVSAADELEDDKPQQTGEYYVALPDGRLQRVRYASSQDVEAMRYFAKIRAENVEPLRGPIYAYAPLQKLQIVPAEVSIAPVIAPNNKPQKLEIEPYDNPLVPLTNPLTYTANYQVPTADSRYILTFQ